jgi:hypothetical protein
MASINATHINLPERATCADIFDEEAEMPRTNIAVFSSDHLHDKRRPRGFFFGNSLNN